MGQHTALGGLGGRASLVVAGATILALALAAETAACHGGNAGGPGPGSDGGASDSATPLGTVQPGTDASPPPSSGDSSTPSTGAVVGGVPGGAIGPGTTISGCEIFPSDNPWNVAIDGTEVQVIHTYDAKLPQGTSLHADFGDYSTNHYGIPFETVPSTQADIPTTFSLYASQSDPGPGGWVGANPVTTNAASGTTAYPFFVGMKIEGDPPGGGTPGNLPNDQHGIVLQQGVSGCTSYEAWNCVPPTSSGALCANGAVFDLTSNALRPAGWTSADAAGLSVLAGLVKLAEVKAGTITHAIRLTFNDTQAGYIPPATHASGSGALGGSSPPMGLRLRLKASVVITSYSAPSQTVMAAMKKYGVMVADIGSDWYFQGDSDDGWDAMAPDGKDTLVDEISSDCGKLKGSDFEAVYSGVPVATGL